MSYGVFDEIQMRSKLKKKPISHLLAIKFPISFDANFNIVNL